VHQVLSPRYEPTFHDSSHGFRPGRSCHTAIAEAQSHLEEGCRWPSRSAEIWSTDVRADLRDPCEMESKRPGATVGCARPRVIGFARQSFGGFFPGLVGGVVGLVLCR
jgi:hypothetical protein